MLLLIILTKKAIDVTGNNSKKSVNVMVPLECLKNVSITTEMPLINSEINLIQNWCKSCVKLATDVANKGAPFSVIDTKIYVSVAILSTQDNKELLQQLTSGFKITINCNKYQLKKTIKKWNHY